MEHQEHSQELQAPKFSVGIDLGTTHCVLSYIDTTNEDARVEVMPIPQLTAPGTVETRSQLGSFLYHCLLYTSPSPRDRQKSRMPSSA